MGDRVAATVTGARRPNDRSSLQHRHEHFSRPMIRALGILKKAAALTNGELKTLPEGQ
jgi:fumarate hydratase class II